MEIHVTRSCKQIFPNIMKLFAIFVAMISVAFAGSYDLDIDSLEMAIIKKK